ncbi:MAG: ABC transporter ATP-binding protein [Oscillospiraceae bacterium]|nr:ABC transporter ATP-binding protein [Oscillospiraceae bacterium]
MTVRFEQIQKIFQSKHSEVCALEDISFRVDAGSFVSIVGPSGCGKSTLLNILAGLETPTSGRVLLDDVPVEGTTDRIGYMPQRDQLFPWRTIWGNVTLGLEIQKKKQPQQLQRIRELLHRYGLESFEKSLPSQLSGGMRQRCALIRTLATDPGLLLLDEPFSALDYQTRLSVSDDIHTIIRREGKTALLVTHDISEAISMSDRVVVLTARPGRVKTICDLPELAGLSPMERRDHPMFHRFFNDIWKELDLGG